MQASNGSTVDDEINLKDLWDALVRRRRLAATLFSLVLLGAALYVATATPVFEAKGAFRIGALGGAPIEKPDEILARIESEFGQGGGAWVSKASQDRKDPLRISFVVQGNTADEAHLTAVAVLDSVVALHKAKLDERRAMASVHLGTLEKLGERGRASLEQMPRQSQDPVQLAAAMNLALELRKLDSEIMDIKNALHVATDTLAVERPVRASAPSRPRLAVILLLAALFGMLVAGFGVYAAEAFGAGDPRRSSV